MGGQLWWMSRRQGWCKLRLLGSVGRIGQFVLAALSCVLFPLEGSAAIQLSSPQLVQGTLTDSLGARIQFTSDQAGYAVVYILADNVAGYRPGEIVRTISGNIVAGLNEFRWDGTNALMRNPNLLAGGNGLANVGVGATALLPDDSSIFLRVVAMNQALWNADWVAGNFASAPTIRILGLDVVGNTVYACDIGNAVGNAQNKVIRTFSAANGSGIAVLPFGAIVGNGSTFEPWDVYAETDGSYVVSSAYSPYGNATAGWLYQFAPNGVLLTNLVTNLGLLRGGDRISTGNSSIFYMAVYDNRVLRVPWGGVPSPVLTNATPSPGALAWNNTVAVAAVYNGANVAPVLYVASQNNHVGVMRYDWNGVGYARNEIFARNVWTDQSGFQWRLLNVIGSGASMNVVGPVGTVVATNSLGLWGRGALGVTLANKADLQSDLFVRTTRGVWRLKSDGTSAWPGYLEPCTNDSGSDLAFDGQSLYFSCGNTGQIYAGRFLVRDAFPESGEAQSGIIVWNSTYLRAGVSHWHLE
ncbi:MAG: hypothetical protein KatS3mg130_0133 [Candidatus Sumerlaea sp.]|nr:MAG: hypothetical protein KatS3mg130_0133 [Candidatus Sumerlaea sp.]